MDIQTNVEGIIESGAIDSTTRITCRHTFNEHKETFGGGFAPADRPSPSDAGDGFMNIPDGIDEELPFN